MIHTVRLDGAKEAAAALRRVELALKGGNVHKVGKTIARSAHRTVVRLTPDRKNPPTSDKYRKRSAKTFREQWEIIEDTTREFHYKATIRNEATKTKSGFAALAAVEFGAKPHPITPRNAKALVWDSPGSARLFRGRLSAAGDGGLGRDVVDLLDRREQLDGVVHTTHVNHPGHRSFRMVSETSRHMVSIGDVMMQQMAAKISREFGYLSVSIR